MFTHTERQSDLLRLQADHLSRYRWACQWATGARCLDLGCGTGYGSRILASSGAVTVTGMDISEEAVEAARSYGGLRNLEFRIGDATMAATISDSKFDLITCFEVIEHVVDPGAILAQIRSLLTEDGVAVISTPNADIGYSDNPFHLCEMRSEEFRALVSGHFKRAMWFAQFDPNERWHRPDWQRKLIRGIPMRIRKLRRSRKNHQPEPVATEFFWEKFNCRHPFSCDEFYPMPWELAMESMYTPPPSMIIVAAQP
jgi:SAM-dependent methyltransferase